MNKISIKIINYNNYSIIVNLNRINFIRLISTLKIYKI